MKGQPLPSDLTGLVRGFPTIYPSRTLIPGRPKERRTAGRKLAPKRLINYYEKMMKDKDVGKCGSAILVCVYIKDMKLVRRSQYLIFRLFYYELIPLNLRNYIKNT